MTGFPGSVAGAAREGVEKVVVERVEAAMVEGAKVEGAKGGVASVEEGRTCCEELDASAARYLLVLACTDSSTFFIFFTKYYFKSLLNYLHI